MVIIHKVTSTGDVFQPRSQDAASRPGREPRRKILANLDFCWLRNKLSNRFDIGIFRCEDTRQGSSTGRFSNDEGKESAKENVT